jgi:tRNA 2-thiocytidine biosynthesis protein TtcA
MSVYNKVKRWVGRAIHGYEMLNEGDFIIAGLSGGEDSLVLLYFLAEWRKKIRKNYRILAVHLDMGFPKDKEGEKEYQEGVKWLKKFAEDLEAEFLIKKTDCGIQALEVAEKGNKNPCFVCSWHRRKHLFKLAEELGANKLALGHHLDDVVVTFFLNLFYHGEISSIVPVQEMFKGKLHIIRPLFFVEKKLISSFVRKMQWQVLKNPCPFSQKTKRKFLEEYLKKHIFSLDPKVKKSIIRAIFNVKMDYLPKMPEKT